MFTDRLSFIGLALGLMLAAAPARSAVVGDEITLTGLYDTTPFVQTGIAGTDAFVWVVPSSGRTRFTPNFAATSIELGFSTTFGTNAWVLDETTRIDFSGLDGGGGLIITSASVFSDIQKSFGGTRVPGDPTFTDRSVSLILDDLFLTNGDTIRIDLAFAPVPLPPALPLLVGALAALWAARRTGRAGVAPRMPVL